ncbi:MAG: phosphohistidine phosphatase SixA [Candidatus Micrarchaeota archaeon]
MELYLVQHAEAKAEEEDPDRPLTRRGREEAGAVASRLAGSGMRVDHIFHSPKLRAMQTADIFNTHLKSHATEAEGLKPMDEPKAALRLIESASGRGESIMIVGHMPHLSKLASLLLSGRDSPPLISFRMAAVICMVKEESGWQVKWMLPPELA